MKNIFRALFFISISLVFFSQNNFVLAETPTTTSSTKDSALQQLHAGAKGAGLQEESTDPRIIASKIIKIFLSLVGTVAIFLFVYAGFLLITSHGESEKVKKASKIMTGAVIGILLILLSFSITNFVSNKVQDSITRGIK
jgi:branched-subunit amino acid transport protein AzlD